MSQSSRRHRKAARRAAATAAAAASACPGPGETAPCECAAERPARQEDIAVRAREIWEERGRPFGQDLEIWLAAEAETFGRAM